MSQPDFPPSGRPRLSVGGYSIPVPASRLMRIALGSLLCLFGLFGFLPILGYWMVPLGIMILAIDVAPARRLRRRIDVWWTRRRENRKRKPRRRSA